MKVKETGQTKDKDKITEFLNRNGLAYYQVTYHGCKGIFIPTSDSENCLAYPGISVTTCNKDIFRVYPHEILYIAIEDRKSVLYLTGKKIETHYSMEHWKAVLDEKTFAQSHYSYLVNLNYVEEISKDFVKIKYENNEYRVYASFRKIGSFKKAFLNFKNKEVAI